MKIISLGMGVQSVALYYMSSMGMLPRVDYAIFADLGREKEGTYKYLNYLQKWQKKNNGIQIIVIREKNLFKDLMNQKNSTGKRFAPIPAYTKNEDGGIGMLRRQCTEEYKIDQMNKKIRELYGLPKGKPCKIPTEIWKGISLDEISRMSNPDVKWQKYVYPFVKCATVKGAHHFIDYGIKMTRNDIINWYNINNLPIPVKSSCSFCPFQSDSNYYDMKVNHPEDFKAAVKIDEAIRNSSQKGINNPIYLHRSCKPLAEIEFKAGSPDLWSGECSGSCHT